MVLNYHLSSYVGEGSCYHISPVQVKRNRYGMKESSFHGGVRERGPNRGGVETHRRCFCLNI